MLVGMALFWLAVVGLIAWLVRSGRGRGVPQRETALEVLQRRCAEGSIPAEEYAERRRILDQEGRDQLDVEEG